jgi:transcriptional regulator with XRE-family HTH domain
MLDEIVKKNRQSNMPDSIPAKIRQLRRDKGISQVLLAEYLGVSQGTLSEWEKGSHPPSPMALMAIGRFDDDATWWYEQAGPRFAESLKGGRLIQDVRAKLKGGAATNAGLLAQVLEAVEAEMNRAGGFFTTQIRAGIISQVYDEWRKPGDRNCKIIERLVEEARSPSNRKGKLR